MILQGYFRILNFFDIAEAIELDKLRALLGPEAGPLTAAFRQRLSIRKLSKPPSSNQ